MEDESFEDKRFALSEDDILEGFIIRDGQKTTIGIEDICQESQLASIQISMNQYF